MQYEAELLAIFDVFFLFPVFIILLPYLGFARVKRS